MPIGTNNKNESMKDTATNNFTQLLPFVKPPPINTMFTIKIKKLLDNYSTY